MSTSFRLRAQVLLSRCKLSTLWRPHYRSNQATTLIWLTIKRNWTILLRSLSGRGILSQNRKLTIGRVGYHFTWNSSVSWRETPSWVKPRVGETFQITSSRLMAPSTSRTTHISLRWSLTRKPRPPSFSNRIGSPTLSWNTIGPGWVVWQNPCSRLPPTRRLCIPGRVSGNLAIISSFKAVRLLLRHSLRLMGLRGHMATGKISTKKQRCWAASNLFTITMALTSRISSQVGIMLVKLLPSWVRQQPPGWMTAGCHAKKWHHATVGIKHPAGAPPWGYHLGNIS